MFKLQLAIFCYFISKIVALNCDYFNSQSSGYSCRLSINNAEGSDDFFNVTGKHITAKTDKEVISISRGSGQSKNIPSIICTQFTSLEHFHFPNGALEFIKTETFKQCKNLKVLNLNDNRIRELPVRVFEKNVNLNELRISNNQLKSLPDGAFKNLRQLKVLSLSNNSIFDFYSMIFRNQTNLMELNLASCELEAIRPKWLENLNNLQILSLFDNFITKIPRNLFATLANLKILNLAANKIDYFDSFAIANNSKLLKLYLNKNKLKKLQRIYFPSSLTTLDIGSNYFDDIHVESFKMLTNLQTLEMSFCNIRELKFKWFTDLKSLKSLGLAGNEIEELPSGIFKDLNLKHLNLDGNRLRTISTNSFNALDNLLQFYARKNEINSIDLSFFNLSRNLFFAWFDGNECIDENFSNFSKNLTNNLKKFKICFEAPTGEILRSFKNLIY